MEKDDLELENDADLSEDPENEDLENENLEDPEKDLEKEPELDEDGNPIEKDEKPVEEWLQTDDDQTSETVPKKTHMQMKRRMKGKVDNRDSQIERLKEENAALKNGSSNNINNVNQSLKDIPKRPRRDDYDDDDKYYDDLEAYDDDRADKRQRQNAAQVSQSQAHKKLGEDVDAHYDRADKLLKSSGITQDVYMKVDAKLEKAIEDLRPGKGKLIKDHLISLLGEGSEKVMYSTGVKQSSLDKLISALAQDSSGSKAILFLGQEKQRLTNTKPRQQSNAKKPAARAEGDAETGKTFKTTKTAYDAAHKKKRGQEAYNIKKAARKAGIDTSKW